MLRGIERKSFFINDEDKQRLIDTIVEKRKLDGFSLLAYCIMDNHVHFLMKERNETVSQSIKRIGTSFAFYYNKKYDRVGHLFQDRFKSEPVRSDGQLHEVFRYINNNPVKAGMVKRMEEYKWSSYWRYKQWAHGCRSNNMFDELANDFKEVISTFSDDMGKAERSFIEFCKERMEGTFIDIDISEKSRDKKRTLERINKVMADLGITKEEAQINGEKRLVLLKKLKFEEGIPIRQIAEAVDLDRNTVQKVRTD